MTIAANSENSLAEIACRQEVSLASAITHANPTTQLLLSTKLVPHRPEAGLNPIVDAAAHLFSLMGKLKHLKSHHNLLSLHHELVREIEQYQLTVKACHYNAERMNEYIPITTYALCATLDDVIATTPWGNQGRWDAYSMVVAFNQEPLSQKSFFVILERLVRDPAIYIDVMEFMYICLSLGFRCHYGTNSSDFDHEQLEHITNALYKRIRAYRGNFTKTLSPFSIKSSPAAALLSPFTHLSVWFMMVLAGGFLIALFMGGKYMLNRTYNQVDQTINVNQEGRVA
jgi:type VI secretion system protein ImpK